MKVKEYKLQLTFSIECDDADYERVELFAHELADTLIQDHTLSYDDIEIVDYTLNEIQYLNDYDAFEKSDDDDDEDLESEEY